MKWGRSTGAFVEHALQEMADTFDQLGCRHTALAKKTRYIEQTECEKIGSFDPNDTSDCSEVLVAYMSPLVNAGWETTVRVGRGHKNDC